MRFAEFIKQHMEEILQEWERFARSLPPGKDMDVSSLRDHAQDILETIADDMAAPQSVAESATKSRGEGPLMRLALDFALKHVVVRHDEGFDLNQVVAEYRALRASVIKLWTRKMQGADPQTLHDLIRFNEEIDQALTYAVAEFERLADNAREETVAALHETEERLRQDIADRQRLEEELREADRRKDEFLATLAHELRNPLAPIRTGLDVLRLHPVADTGMEDALEMMERQMNHLVRLVDDLMDISRISRGKVKLRRESVDIRDAIVRAMETTDSYISAGERRVHVHYPASPLFVQADPVRLVQVIGNLLSNAGKHTDEHGNIWIAAGDRDGWIHVSVRDDGTGMTQETIGRLFQMFMQVDSQRMGGLGIGLALVRSLVELHGGTVEAHSDGLGHGSEFIIRLPRAEAPVRERVPAQGDRQNSGNAPLGSKR